jgi:hypothetical protein
MDGEANATAYGMPIEAPRMKGGTGIGELGLKISPGADVPFTADLGVQGYAGKREGVTGSLTFRFEF